MKNKMKLTLGMGFALFLAGLFGSFFVSNGLEPENRGSSCFNGWNRGYMNRGMMFGNADIYNTPNSGEKIELEELKELVDSYIEAYGESLEISDIFTFENSDYYFSIVEEDTGFGAMELLVNPYTGNIYPEHGPNMMWNLKYGMHGYGMMGRGYGHGMMGSNNFEYDYFENVQDFDGNPIIAKDARDMAQNYIESIGWQGYTIPEGGHEFYGYYTFHIEKEGETAGMISVNGFTGSVWYHNWHGKVTEVVEEHGHDDEEH